MSPYEKFIDPIVSIDKISMVINFLPLINRQHAYQFLRKTGILKTNRFDGDITEIDTVDWTGDVCEALQILILDDSYLSGGSGGFKQSSHYSYTIQLPIGVYLEFGRNKNARLLHKLEYYGPYREDDPIRYHSIYETYETASQMRIEWNPNKTDISIMKHFFRFISYASGFDPLNDIKISRMDVAVDVSHEVDLCMVTSTKNVDQNTYTDRSGGITKYIGSTASGTFTRTYNKKEELRKKSKIIHPNDHFYRFESVRKKDKGFFLGDDDEACKDMFDKILIIDSEKLLKCDDLLIKSFFTIARLTDVHFDAVVNESMKGCERTKVWRLKKKFRQYEKSTQLHPSVIFNKQFNSVWKKFKNNFLSSFNKEKI